MADGRGERDAYILGTDAAELRRLRSQHAVWEGALTALCARAGVGPGAAVLDLGCGPGFTTLALARAVGATGRVVGVDRSARFVAHLRARAARVAPGRVVGVVGSVEDPAPAGAPFDAVYARWVLFWLPRPEAALRRAAEALRRGGVVLVQDYIRWGDLRLAPRSAPVDAAVDACLRHWRAAGVAVDVMERVTDLADLAGLRVEDLRPLARIAPVGAPEWHWIGDFLHAYLPRVVEAGFLDAAGLDAFRAAWREREDAGRGHVIAPVMAEAILRRD